LIDLTSINELRKNGKHQEAKVQLVKLAAQFPNDPDVQYATAWLMTF